MVNHPLEILVEGHLVAVLAEELFHGVADMNLVGEDDVPLHGAKPKRLLDLMERIPWEESVAVR